MELAQTELSGSTRLSALDAHPTLDPAIDRIFSVPLAQINLLGHIRHLDLLTQGLIPLSYKFMTHLVTSRPILQRARIPLLQL